MFSGCNATATLRAQTGGMRIPTLTATLFALFTTSFAHANLGDALRFAPATASAVYFTDWAAVLDDMAGAYSAEPTPGDTAFVRAMAERHTIVTSTATANHGDPWYVGEQWGWTLLDLEWELETNARVTVLRFAPAFDAAAVVALTQERGYATQSHGDVTAYSHARDNSLEWLRPPFFAYQNLAYLADERVLLLAPTAAALHEALDAYAAQVPSLADDANARGLAETLDVALGAVLITSASACMIPDTEAPQYELAGVGYHFDGGSTRGVVSLAQAGEVTVSTETVDAPGALINPVLVGSAAFLGCRGPG